MGYFTTRQGFFVLFSSSEVEETTKLDRYLQLLEESGVAEVLDKTKPRIKAKGGRPEFSRYDLFATILFGFAYTSGSLRDIESACKNDLRFIALMKGERPSYKVIGNFINDYIVPNTEEIFAAVMRQMVKECAVEFGNAYLDGTKIEADANKYKFVWKPTTHHLKLCANVLKLLDENGLSRGVPRKGIYPSAMIAEKLSEFSVLITEKPECATVLKKQYEQLESYLKKALEYEEKEKICGPDRNSYYKTDHDATAMTMKTDYYAGLGSHMHAAYNAQVIVCNGFACAFNVSQKRNDIEELIPSLDQFYRIYNRYPDDVCADAGYGSLANYSYLKKNHIGNYVKHQSWEGNVSGKNPFPYRLNEDGTITCLNNRTGYPTEIEGRHPKVKGSVFYKITGCTKCPFRKYCKRFQKRRSENYKIFEVNRELRSHIQEAEQNLLSVKGIEIRVNRSCQVEGSFGVLKQNMNYIRFRRISLKKVTAEYMMSFLGYNVRKLFRHFDGNLKTKYWTAPPGLEPEKFKKPSAKRLSNRAAKKKKKSANQKAKTSYKYQKRAG